MKRVLISIGAGGLVFLIALALGIPAWRTWEPGDATDFGMVGATGAYLLLAAKGL